MAFTIFLSVIAWPLIGLVVYFTNWTMFITAYSLWLSIRVVNEKDSSSNYDLLAKHHMFYSLAIICNVVTVTVYWPVIHPVKILEHMDEPLRYYDLYIVHSVPGMVALVNTLITNCLLHRRVDKWILYLSVVYCSVNCIQTKIRGKPLYHFLTWESFDSVLIAAGLALGFAFVYFGLCLLDEMAKPGLVAKRILQTKHKEEKKGK